MVNLDDAEINQPEIAEALRSLENECGCLTPDAVFDAAKSANHPLHRFFEWDHDRGWRAHNLAVARSLISNVRYKIVTEDRGIVRSPVYVKDPAVQRDAQGYVALRTVVKRGPDAHSILAAEIDQAMSHLRRALAVGIAVGFADRLGNLIDLTTSVRSEIEVVISKAA